ncbi:hypothetical protein LTSEALA_4460 [Salmonella enterica subsp. enterica serovar Alachua str. R6-377]|uniref:Uncharacterized protein n=1 Tax=Salmonella enterica subsp. enterica serovar Alachua str. R6-377 TaxID=913241 RepID=G5LTJ5_SALET|nr:hypothetical protein LTSEALA_4460 [Salmonella enterica subsp. enterica serovar Alachua str. R6-377]
MADRIRVKRGLRLHNRQNQRLVNAIFTGGLAYHANVFMRAFIKVVRHQINGDAVNNTQAVTAAFEPRFQQVIRECRGAAFPANRLAGIVEDLTIQEGFFRNFYVIDIGVKIDGGWVVTHEQRFNNSPAQMCGRFRPGDGFNGNGPIIKVDVATGLELIGIFDVVFRPGNQDFLISPQIFNIVGKLPHQNIKAVGILDPGFIIRLAFFGRTGAGDEQRRNNSKRE